MSYITDALDRIVEMQKECLTGIAPDAVPYWPYQQEAFPYWTNRVGATEYNVTGYGEDILQVNMTVLMRLVVGHLDSGVGGERFNEVADYIADTELFFIRNAWLTSTANPTSFDGILQEAIIASHTGQVVFQNSGIGVNQIGVEFTLNLPIIRSVLP